MTESTEIPKDSKPVPSLDRSRMAWRLLHVILVGILIGAATAVLHVMTIVQFIVMLADKGQPNAQIAAFGTALGKWQAKAARFQTAASEDKPWPWSALD